MQKVRLILQRILRQLKNKYVAGIFLFVIWLMFFDQNNMIDRYKTRRQLERLKADKAYYLKKIAADSARLEELKSDADHLEKFAREQYLMKKDNEDIFIIKE
jgi:cell division protein FtsB